MNTITVRFADGSTYTQHYRLENVAMWVRVNKVMGEHKEFPKPHIKLIEIK